MLYQVYTEDFEETQRNLITALPSELVKLVAPNIYKLFANNNYKLDDNIVEVLKHLGEKINKHPFSPYFYYTDGILEGSVTKNKFHRILDIYPHFLPKRNVVYTDILMPIEHYIISLKFHSYRLFYPAAFAKEVVPINKEFFIEKIDIITLSFLIDYFADEEITYMTTITLEKHTGIFVIKRSKLLCFFCF